VDRDATVAARGDGDSQRDELADFFTEMGGFGVSAGEGLIAANRVGGELHEFGEFGADLFLVFVPVKHHGKFLSEWSRGSKV